jgi:uncharacterized protein VirK/YbjX
MGCQQRMEMLMAHYRFVCRQGLAPLVAQAARAPVVLARFHGRSGGEYRIELSAIGSYEREGEMILQLSDGELPVYSTVFSFVARDGGTELGIGCIQGPKGQDGLERIRLATRELHGLRPKNLLVRLAREIGHLYGCERMLLVANANRTVRSATRQGRVHADYDATWEEMGAQRGADGNYGMSCGPLEAPVLEEVASKKRAEVRRRHELMVQLAAMVAASMAVRRAAPVVRLAMASNDAVATAVAIG